MSKRFGRNQKRKMRERISQLQEAQAMDRGLAEYLGKKVRSLESEMELWDRRVRQLLCDESGYARGAVVRGSGPKSGSYEFPIRQELDMSSGPCVLADIAPMFRETMHKLEVEVRTDPIKHARILHLYVGNEAGLSYYISESMMAKNGFGSDVVRYVVEEAMKRMDQSIRSRRRDDK